MLSNNSFVAQISMDEAYQMPPVARRNFSNPMYDEFHRRVDQVMNASAEEEAQKVTPSAESTLPPVGASSPVAKKTGLLAKIMKASPLNRRRAQKENDTDSPKPFGEANEETEFETPKQFSPTNIDTDRDTQALVEED